MDLSINNLVIVIGGIVVYIAGLISRPLIDEIWKRYVSVDRPFLIVETDTDQIYTVETDEKMKRLVYQFLVNVQIYNKGKEFTSLISRPVLIIQCEDNNWQEAYIDDSPLAPKDSVFYKPEMKIEGRHPPLEGLIQYSLFSDNKPLITNNTITGRLFVTATHGQVERRQIIFTDITEESDKMADLWLEEFYETREKYPDLSDEDISYIMAYGEQYLSYKESDQDNGKH